jgi:hypothetical protein
LAGVRDRGPARSAPLGQWPARLFENEEARPEVRASTGAGKPGEGLCVPAPGSLGANRPLAGRSLVRMWTRKRKRPRFQAGPQVPKGEKTRAISARNYVYFRARLLTLYLLSQRD